MVEHHSGLAHDIPIVAGVDPVRVSEREMGQVRHLYGTPGDGGCSHSMLVDLPPVRMTRLLIQIVVQSHLACRSMSGMMVDVGVIE